MDIRFDGKRALVTGAAGAIGKATAKALLRGGAEVYALDVNQVALDALHAEVPEIHKVVADLRDWDATKQAVCALGNIDLLVNNAGVVDHQPFLEVTQGAFDMMMDVHAKATLNISQVVVEGMVRKGRGGSIVNMSSQTSLAGIWNRTAYSASKAAVDGMTRVMALELGPHQIRVNTLHPTAVMTPLGRKAFSDPARRAEMLSKIPMQKFAEVDDVVHAILYLLSDKADMITGAALPVDGGFLAT